MNPNLNYNEFLDTLPPLLAAQVAAHLADLEGAGYDSSAVPVCSQQNLTDASKPGRQQLATLREGDCGTDPNQILDLKGAAKVLGVSKAHLSKMLSGLIPGLSRIPHVRAGRSVRVRRGTLLEWFRQAELESARGLTQ
jgi:hypothetical protein